MTDASSNGTHPPLSAAAAIVRGRLMTVIAVV